MELSDIPQWWVYQPCRPSLLILHLSQWSQSSPRQQHQPDGSTRPTDPFHARVSATFTTARLAWIGMWQPDGATEFTLGRSRRRNAGWSNYDPDWYVWLEWCVYVFLSYRMRLPTFLSMIFKLNWMFSLYIFVCVM